MAELRDVLRDEYRFFKNVVERAAGAFGPAWAPDLERTLDRLFPDHEALALAARGYAHFVIDLLRRQRRFEQDRTYPNKTYAEAAQEVYFDDDYMTSQYLPGLLIAHFLWPHHHRHAAFFDAAFATPMALREAPRFAEVGVGTGLYSRRLLEHIPSASGVGFDISPASAGFATGHIRAFGLQDRYEVRLSDVVAEGMAPCEWLVCIEVLEHLEDPVGFLTALRAAVVPGGRAFITAALNAAHVDHIFLYETVEDVIAQLVEAGFAVEQGFIANAHPPTAPGLPVPAVAAFVVT